MTSRPDSDENERVPSGEIGLLLREIDRLNKSVQQMAQEFREGMKALRDDHEGRADKLEERIRALEIEQGKTGVRVGIAVTLAGLLGAGVSEALALFVTHSH